VFVRIEPEKLTFIMLPHSLEILKKLIEEGIGADKPFVIYGGGLWGSIVVKQVAMIAASAPVGDEVPPRPEALQHFFANWKGSMIHKDCALPLDMTQFIQSITAIVRQVTGKANLLNPPRPIPTDEHIDDIPSNLLYLWSLEKAFGEYTGCSLGESVDDWTRFIEKKAAELRLPTLHATVSRNTLRPSKAAPPPPVSAPGSAGSTPTTTPVSSPRGAARRYEYAISPMGAATRVTTQGSSSATGCTQPNPAWLFLFVLTALPPSF
jgi:hypothetical protein